MYTPFQILLLRARLIQFILSRHSFEPSSSPTLLFTAFPSDNYALGTTDIEFYLMNHSAELSEAEVEEFVFITLPFLRSQLNTVLVNLKSFEVMFQDIIIENRRKLRSSSNANDAMLKLTIRATGQLLSSNNTISDIELMKSIVKVMKTDEFSRLLNQSQSFQQTSIYFSAIIVPEDDDKPDQEKKTISGSMIAIVSSLVILSIGVVAIGLLYRLDRLPYFRYSTDQEGKGDMLNDMYDEDFYADEESASSNVSDKMKGVCISKILSKHSSDESLLDLNGKDRGNDKVMEHPLAERKIIEHEGGDEENAPRFFANCPEAAQLSHIPPMIVIDNIDNEDDEAMVRAKNGASNNSSPDNIFVRRIQATSDLVAALSAKKTPNPIQAYNLFK